MLCQDCGKSQATVKLTQVVNNEKTVLHLCQKCAEKRGLNAPLGNISFSLGELFSEMVEKPRDDEDPGSLSVVCGRCGYSYADIRRVGRLGCAECYQVFSTQLKDLLRRIHGSNEHIGKFPAGQGERAELKIEIRKLREKLKKAVEEEDFEEAARLRDRIKQIEKKEEILQ